MQGLSIVYPQELVKAEHFVTYLWLCLSSKQLQSLQKHIEENDSNNL